MLDEKKSLEILMYCDIWGFLNSKLLNIALLRIIHQSKMPQGPPSKLQTADYLQSSFSGLRATAEALFEGSSSFPG